MVAANVVTKRGGSGHSGRSGPTTHFRGSGTPITTGSRRILHCKRRDPAVGGARELRRKCEGLVSVGRKGQGRPRNRSARALKRHGNGFARIGGVRSEEHTSEL